MAPRRAKLRGRRPAENLLGRRKQFRCSGGNGYLKHFPAERMMRDAKVLQIYEGANEIQALVIARQMLKPEEAAGALA